MALILPDDARFAVRPAPCPPHAAGAAVLSGANPHAPRGWTAQRQTDFLGMLAETGSVVGACEAVGMSRKSAYALRARPGAESFTAAWDAALGMPVRKVTVPDLHFLAHHGLIRPLLFRGRYRGAWSKPDDSALLRLCGRLDRLVQDEA